MKKSSQFLSGLSLAISSATFCCTSFISGTEARSGFEVESASPYAACLVATGKRDAGSDAPAKACLRPPRSDRGETQDRKETTTMARRKKEPIITVKTFFDGEQTAQEVFVELILRDYPRQTHE